MGRNKVESANRENEGVNQWKDLKIHARLLTGDMGNTGPIYGGGGTLWESINV